MELRAHPRLHDAALFLKSPVSYAHTGSPGGRALCRAPSPRFSAHGTGHGLQGTQRTRN